MPPQNHARKGCHGIATHSLSFRPAAAALACKACAKAQPPKRSHTAQGNTTLTTRRRPPCPMFLTAANPTICACASAFSRAVGRNTRTSTGQLMPFLPTPWKIKNFAISWTIAQLLADCSTRIFRGRPLGRFGPTNSGLVRGLPLFFGSGFSTGMDKPSASISCRAPLKGYTQ